MEVHYDHLPGSWITGKLWNSQSSQELGVPCAHERGRSGAHHAQTEPQQYCLHQTLSGGDRRRTTSRRTAIEPLARSHFVLTR